MTATYLISIGDGEMLGLGQGGDPAAAVEDYCSAMDAFGSGSDEIGQRFSVGARRIPDELTSDVHELTEDRFDEALPDVEDLVVRRAGANWQTADVVIEGGDG